MADNIALPAKVDIERTSVVTFAGPDGPIEQELTPGTWRVEIMERDGKQVLVATRIR